MQKKLPLDKVLGYFGTKKKARLLQGTFMALSFFCFSDAFSQTTLINPATDGGFNTGSTFAANGWTVANEGTGIIKWVVGTAVNSAPIAGNSAYISVDNGVNNTYAGVGQAKTAYFYRDVVIPAGQTNIALSFNWRAGANSWQVFAAPTSVTPVGSDTALSTSGFPSVFPLAGATPIVLGVVNGTTVQKATGFIPASFAGTTMRLIFMWTNNTGAANPPLAIDNISLVSRVGAQTVSSIATGNYSDATTWDTGYVPSPTDDVVINAGHTVTVDNRMLGAENLFIAGAGAIFQFGVDTEEYTVNTDLLVSGSGARCNVYNGTSGRSLKVGHNIDVASGGRLDISAGSSSLGAGQLDLFGSGVQTVSVSSDSFIGGTVASTSSSTNTAGVLNQLNVTNNSVASPNVVWNVNNVRIKNALRLNKARVGLGTNKIILGNFTAISTLVAPFGNGFIGGIVSRWYSTANTGTAVTPGTDHNPSSTAGLYPFVSSTGKNRSAYIISQGTAATTAGELEVAYTDANTMTTGLSVADGAYTVTDRYDGKWTVTAAGSGTGTVYANTAGTFTFGAYATGAYETNDGTSRIMYASGAISAPSEHINGTTTPFASRKTISLANLTANALYIGTNNGSILGTTTATSTASGDWNNPAIWSTNAVPTCTDVVKIAAGNTVTSNNAANAAGLTIEAGATLVKASNTLTVGCSNNNAVVANYGTLTVSGGTVTVNGGVTHKVGSTFNHTGGNIIIDSNAGGVAANSVGIGGSSLKIETSSLNLTGGTITIVDPLINNAVATTATSGADFTVATFGAAGTFTKSTISTVITAGSTTLTISNPAGNGSNAVFGVGQLVSGPGIAPGTTIVSVTAVQTSAAPFPLVLSQPITADIPASTAITFSSMNNGSFVLDLDAAATNAANVSIGQVVSGSGIPAGTTVVAKAYDNNAPSILGVTLSNAISGLATSPITAPQTITFSAVAPNCSTIILSAANPAIVVGQPVGGTGIQPGTTVATISGTKLDLSLPTTAAVTNPVTLSFYDGNPGSYAVSYNSPNHYAAGTNHTLQIGDGVSTDKAAVTTNGYLCNFAQGGGQLSLGKLTVNALDGTNRFLNISNTALNVQDAFTITSGSVFKKTSTSGILFFGGNIVNNGTAYMNTVQVKLTNFINGAEVPATLPQTISGTGVFYNGLASNAVGAVTQFIVNNTNPAGVTIAVPNFRVVSGITMTAGIIHTSAATPLIQGNPDLAFGTVISGNFSDTCFIDGPFSKGIPTNSNNTTFVIYPVGKTSYKPISLAVTGGGDFTVEAFDANTGTAAATMANLSNASRWKVTRNGALGALTNFNVRVGAPGIASNNIVAQASTDQGTYNSLGTATFAAGTPNTITTDVATLGASFTGFFGYGTNPNCTTVNPGNTIADLSITQVVHTQTTTSTGIVSGNATVTLAAAPNALIVPGLTVTGNGIAPGTTVVSVSASPATITLSQAAITSSASAQTLTFTSVQTPSTLCGSQMVTLKLQNAVAGNGVTYQWQSSSNSSTGFTDIAGATAATYTVSPTATLYYRCTVTCPFGPVTVNSTPVQVVFSSDITNATGGGSCTPGTAINLNATASSGTISWYDLPAGGTALATGGTYSPSPAVTTTYYVGAESMGTPYTAGRTFSGTTTSTGDFSGLVFNANTNIKLNSVKIHPKQAVGTLPQPITIKLFDKNGNQVPGTNAVTITPTVNTGTIGLGIFDVVTLNYNIPAGSGYKLLVVSGLSTNNAIGRLSTGNAPVAQGLISITGSVSSLLATPTTDYYNFFELNVTDVCSSPRVPVTAMVTNTPAPTATATQDACSTRTIADFVVNGQPATTAGFTWYNASTLGSTIPTSTPAVIGTIYYVSQTINGCEGPRTGVTAGGPCLGTNDFRIAELKYFPNPVNDQLSITAKDVITRVEVYNLIGQQLRTLETDTNNVQMNFSGLASSTYLVKVYSEDKVEVFKVIKR